ncbi:MAG TPA: hypothetical protein VFD88_02025 [Clostridia bacterium]|nr:hypothetical protein [Clostridia bacterium]
MDREELLRTITTAHRELEQLVERISDDGCGIRQWATGRARTCSR